MKRWLGVFTVMAIVFLTLCLPFSGYFFAERCIRQYKKYKKSQRKAEREKKRHELRVQRRQERLAAKQAQE